MQTGYYSSASGMVTQFNRIDTIANNLANVNTTGFKEDNLVVGDFMRLYQEKRDELENKNNTHEASSFLNRTLTKSPQVVDKYTDFSVGMMEKSSNSLDFALSKEGLFFVVKTPEGLRLTRDGSFTTDDEGKLVTKDGYEVLGDDYFTSNDSITLSESNSIISVDKNGQIYTNIAGGLKLSANKKFFIAQPQDIQSLEKVGDNLYKTDDVASLTPLDSTGAIQQGFIEKSNVNAVKMMTQLIETNRLVGMYQKAMDTQMNDMNKDAIEKIARKA